MTSGPALSQSFMAILLVVVGCRGSRPEVGAGQQSIDSPRFIEARSQARPRSWGEKLAEQNFVDGSIFQMRGMIPEAIVRYRSALHHQPRNAAIHYALSRVFQASGQLDSALTHARIAAGLDSTSIPVRLLLSDVLGKSGKTAEASTELEILLRLDPDQLQARYDLVRSISETDPDRAFGHLQYLRERLPDDEIVAFMLADARLRRGDTAGALKSIIGLVEVLPDDIAVYVAVVEFALRIGEWHSARDVMWQLKTRHGASSDGERALAAFTHDAVRRLTTRRDDKTIDWGRTMTSLLGDHDWKSADGHVEVARLHYALGDSTRSDARIALGIQRGCAWEEWRRVIDVYLRDGHDRRAEYLLLLGRDAHPDQPEIHIYLARIAWRDQRYREAERFVRRSLALVESPVGYEELAWIRYLRGDSHGALRYILRSAALGGHSPRLFMRMGDIHRSLGDHRAATEAYRQGLRIDTDDDALRQRLAEPMVEHESTRSEPVLQRDPDQQD